MTETSAISGSCDALSISYIGDSDIARWPSNILHKGGNTPRMSGHSGATLVEILPFVEQALQAATSFFIKNPYNSLVFVVVCAGENDIGNGLPLDETLASFEKLLNMLHTPYQHLIFLGPKIEPWLSHDPMSQKKYVKMSKAFGRAAEKHPKKDQIWFIDCLTMFCGESGTRAGAILGRLARAEPQYFADDQLHLNDLGYERWTQVVEEKIELIMAEQYGLK